MKKLICVLISLMMFLGAAAYAEPAPVEKLFTPGTYSAEAQGIFVPVKVQITVSENEIISVLIDATGETPELGGMAAGTLAESILNAQTPNVDALSGATVTSNAIIAAATEALKAAGADIAVLDAQRKDTGADAKEKEEKTVDTEIVIIGAGGAGMTAAIMAKQEGKDFVLLEKMPYAGGNTTKATGGMNAAETHYQKEQGIEDSKALFAADTMKGGHALNDPELVAELANSSSDAIDWLDTIGAALPKISFSGGASVNRIHAPEDGSGVGGFLVEHFSAKLEELGVSIMYNTDATELLVDAEGKICGVKAEGQDANYIFNCKAVILATGGFGANEEMYTQYRPDLKGTVTTNAPGATGDGILMAQALGADLVDIEQIQLHPTVEQSTSMLITESVRGDGAILVNQKGERFTNELLTRDAVSAAELEQEGQYAWIIFDQNLRDHLKAIEKYVKANLTKQGDTIEALAAELEIDPATLAKTLSDWNEMVKNQRDTQFGRTTGMNADLSTAPYYAIKVAPGIHHTMGGIKIDTKAQVINTEGQPIPGLFAAGEVCGGVHGGNRLGGNAVADIVIFGRIAAQSAFDYLK
ncbi:MAG: flavocytochrome c [Eubacteriales bacterium]